LEDRGSITAYPQAVPDPEVSEKAVRRKFTADYKLRIVREAERCTGPGEIGALLRREGLYSSSLTRWRRQMALGLIGKKRGPGGRESNQSMKRIGQLEKENEKLKAKLKQADLIIEVQKKIAEFLSTDNEVKS
jgi:transposase-like protein